MMNEEGAFKKITGGCSCGQIQYEITAPLKNARSCHCSKCRKTFSGAASAYAEVVQDKFIWVSGEEFLKKHSTMPGWGLGFCKNCGSTLCGIQGEKVHGITLGSVDGDPRVQIQMHLFVGSKAPWDHIGGTAPQFDEFPPTTE